MKKNVIDAIYRFIANRIRGIGPKKSLELNRKYGCNFEALKNDELFRYPKQRQVIEYAVQKFSSFSYCPYCGKMLIETGQKTIKKTLVCKKCKIFFTQRKNEVR